VNKVSKKTFTNFNEFDQISRKSSHFQGVSSALEKKFQILALFKEVQGPAQTLIDVRMYHSGKSTLIRSSLHPPWIKQGHAL